MKFRCPYCKTIIVPELHSSYPECGKAMKIPAKLQQTTGKERKKKRQQIVRKGEREKKKLGIETSSNPLRKPAVTFMLLMLIAAVGALLLGRSNNMPKKRKQPPEDRAIMELRALYIASDRFFYDCGRYPTTNEYLKALVINPGLRSWRGPYVNIIKPDPWKNRYIYTVTNNTITVYSTGADGITGTGDDVYPYEDLEPESSE